MTDHDLKSAVDHLAASETGRSVLRHLLALLEEGGCSLDDMGAVSVDMLIHAVRLGKAGTVLELLRERTEA